MLKRMCGHTGCRKIIDADRRYCEKHEVQHRQQHKNYKRARMKDQEEARRQQFYSSRQWELCRSFCECWCFGIDILELYRTGEVVDAETYHHITEITIDWYGRLNAQNIIGLSNSNHALVHAAYDRGIASRRKMQQELHKAKQWFEKEYRRFDGSGKWSEGN